MESEEILKSYDVDTDEEDSEIADSDSTVQENLVISDDLDPSDDKFVGFSPSSSPGLTPAHQTVKKLEDELEVLAVKSVRPTIAEIAVDSVTSETKEMERQRASPVREEKVEPTTSTAGADETSTGKRRGTSPADSGSSQGSFQRSTSTSSWDSKGSVKLEPKEATPQYLAPFKKGWKRELNVREGATDVCYIHPLGQKLKNMEEVLGNLTEGLTGENFTFVPEALNAGSENEIVNKDTGGAPSVRKSGRVPVPSSNYKIVERLEEESRKRGGSGGGGPDSPMAPPAKREKLVLKLKPSHTTANGKAGWMSTGPLHHHPAAPKGPLRKVTPVAGDAAAVPPAPDPADKIPAPPAVQRKRSASARKKGVSADPAGFAANRRKEETAWSAEKLGDTSPRRICSIACPMAMGLIPTLQCCVCLCLYHPECAEVGRTGSTRQIHAYVCKSCRGKPDVRNKPETAVPAVPAAPVQAPPQPPVPPGVPQVIVTLNRRRFVMVPNLSATPVGAAPGPALPPTSGTIPVADLPSSEPTAALKPEGAATKKSGHKKDSVDANSMANFMQNICSGYSALLHVFKYLTVPELLRAARVCRLWKDLAEHPSLWRTVRMKNAQVTDWVAFAAALRRRGTRHLDLRQISAPLVGGDSGYAHLATVESLESLELTRMSMHVLRCLLESQKGLRVCSAQIIPNIDEEGLDVFTPDHRLEELRIKSLGPDLISLANLSLAPLRKSLRVLSLLSFTNWQAMDLSCLEQLSALTELELGECSTLPTSFPPVLLSLTNLERVRLEAGSVDCPTVAILQSLSTLPRLSQLELINFDGRPGFDDALANLHNIRSFLLIPTFVTQAGTKISSVLCGIYRLRDTLKQFVWVFTLEFLQVTELYIDKYSPSKAKKTTAAGSKVPILMPLPVPEDTSGNPLLWQDAAERYGEPGTIAVVPMAELQEMLMVAMPNTQTLITKISSQATSRQTLRDLLP